MKLFRVRANFNWGTFYYMVWAASGSEAVSFVKDEAVKNYPEYMVRAKLAKFVENLIVQEVALAPGVLFCNAGYNHDENS